MRPAQPVGVTPLCAAFCHSNCWSGWENRFVGSSVPALYCAFVVGSISVPTFATNATLLLLNSVAISGKFGFSAKFGIALNCNNWLCGIANGPRTVEEFKYPVVS